MSLPLHKLWFYICSCLKRNCWTQVIYESCKFSQKFNYVNSKTNGREEKPSCFCSLALGGSRARAESRGESEDSGPVEASAFSQGVGGTLSPTSVTGWEGYSVKAHFHLKRLWKNWFWMEPDVTMFYFLCFGRFYNIL